MLKKLEQKGYLTRHRSEEDERNLLVCLTPEGAALAERAKEIPRQMCACLALPEEDIRLLKTALDQLMAAFSLPQGE